jgi:hypothetical protein
MPGSSWNDGTTTEVDARWSLTIGRAVCDMTNRANQTLHTIVPAMAIGTNGRATSNAAPIASMVTPASPITWFQMVCHGMPSHHVCRSDQASAGSAGVIVMSPPPCRVPAGVRRHPGEVTEASRGSRPDP